MLAALAFLLALYADPAILDGTWQVSLIDKDGEVEKEPGDAKLVIGEGNLALLLTVSSFSAEEPKTPAGTPELRAQCRAYLAYTTALAEEESKPRKALLTKAIEQDPRQARAYYNRGFLYVNEGDLARAKADFQKAVELEDGYIQAHYNLACVHSLSGRPDEALASLEAALAKGYTKFDKIPKDSDFKALKDKPAFTRLIAKYKEKADADKPTALQRFQMTNVEGRGDLLTEAIREPDKQAADLARWAMHEPDAPIRVLSLRLWHKLDVPASRPALVKALYDTNGTVSKAAANHLIGYGKDIEPLMIWCLEDKESPAPFYAMQVLATIGARSAADKIVPFLTDDDSRVRIMAAESLARLRAVAALPKLEMALTKLPKEEAERDAYRAALKRAIATLNEAKDKDEK